MNGIMQTFMFTALLLGQGQSFLQKPPTLFKLSKIRSYNIDATPKRQDLPARDGLIRLFGTSSGGVDLIDGGIINGERIRRDDDDDDDDPVSKNISSSSDERVLVTVRYNQGLTPFYSTVAKKIEMSHPDVEIEKWILPALDDDSKEGLTFEVVVEGKVIVGNQRNSRSKSTPGLQSPSVFVSMFELDLAIAKARRKRRRTTSS